MIYCQEAKEIIGQPDFQCCGSCHTDDEDFGYDLCGGGLDKHGGREWYICCALSSEVGAWQKKARTEEGDARE